VDRFLARQREQALAQVDAALEGEVVEHGGGDAAGGGEEKREDEQGGGDKDDDGAGRQGRGRRGREEGTK